MEKREFHQIFRTLRETHRLVMHEQFRAIGLSRGQPKVIEYLTNHDGCIQKELADNCHIKASTVTNILVTMETQGLITRLSSEQDRRILRVYLTDRGWDMAKKIKVVNRNVDALAWGDLTASQRETLLDLLEEITANMQEREVEDDQAD